jgi:hypothetical protein
MPLNRRGVQGGAPLGIPPKDKYIEISSSKALFFEHNEAGSLGPKNSKVIRSQTLRFPLPRPTRGFWVDKADEI